MIISMTGFGRGEWKQDNQEINVEIRTLNNRYLDVNMRIPKSMYMYEDEIKNQIRQYINRGRVNLTITLKNNSQEHGAFQINFELASHYLKLLNALKKELKLKDSPDLEHLLQFRDIFLVEPDELLSDEIWGTVKKVVDMALANLRQMRLDEGQSLSEDLQKRIQILDEKIAAIEELAVSRVQQEYERVRERIRQLGIVENVDEGRLETEVALMASRMDITEECIRFKSHNKLFLAAMDSDEPAGRKLNFLLQEMTREANTIGAKAYDAQIAHLVVDIKEEVEKIREQVQNIE